MTSREFDDTVNKDTLATTMWDGDDDDDPGEPSLEAEALIAEVVRPETERTTVERTIARGGMGLIEAVMDQGLQRRAARKVLPLARRNDLQSVRLFIREAQITSHLDHPNIVPVHSIGLDEGELHFTMKLVEGRTLAEIIHALPDGALSRKTLFELIEIVVKVSDALSLAHSRDVLHCDIKPENIMVGSFGEVYLMDWGIARFKHGHELESTSPWRFAPTGEITAVIGTVAYMSPEQASADTPNFCEATDVFGLGATLYEVLTGRPPYHDLSYSLGISRAQRAQFPSPGEVAPARELPQALVDIVERATEYDISARFSSVGELRAELSAFMHGEASFPSVTFEQGETIISEGEAGDVAYIIVEGACGVYRGHGPERVRLRRMIAGEVFGETAILSPGPRTASVIAESRMIAQMVTAEALTGEVDAMRPWMGHFIKTLAVRFRESQLKTDPGEADCYGPAPLSEPDTSAPTRTTRHRSKLRDAGIKEEGKQGTSLPPPALVQAAFGLLLFVRAFGSTSGRHISINRTELPKASQRALRQVDSDLRQALEAFPEFVVDDSSQVILIRNWRRLAETLRALTDAD